MECQKFNARVAVTNGSWFRPGSQTRFASVAERAGFRLFKVSGANVTLGMECFRQIWSRQFWTTAIQLSQEKENAGTTTA